MDNPCLVAAGLRPAGKLGNYPSLVLHPAVRSERFFIFLKGIVGSKRHHQDKRLLSNRGRSCGG